jgi:phosphoglycerate dehydrogenase-like enzyme
LARLASSSNAHGAHLEPIPFVTLEELLEQSDVVSVHAPANKETRHLFNSDRFARMKPTAFFINTARGALVDDIALREALETGRLRGAGIDVYQEEPLPADHFIRRLPNCVLAPHNAFNSVEAATAMSLQAAENILTVLRGDQPEDVCNPEVLTSPILRLHH